MLEGFDIHETYAITCIIAFIMTGRTNTNKIENVQLKEFVEKELRQIR